MVKGCPRRVIGFGLLLLCFMLGISVLASKNALAEGGTAKSSNYGNIPESGYEVGLDEYIIKYQNLEKEIYSTYEIKRNIPYGKAERETFDLVLTGKKDAPIFVFVHGGYWRSATKELFAWVIRTPLRLGYDCVLIEYTLTPEVNLEQMTAQIGAALDAIQEGLKVKENNRKLLLMGHSAGAHLAAMWQGHPAVSESVLVSGLYELGPLSTMKFIANVGITPQDVEKLSPARHVKNFDKPIFLYCGGEEGSGFFWQQKNYYELLKNAGNMVWASIIPDTNHFSVLETLVGEEKYWKEWENALKK